MQMRSDAAELVVITGPPGAGKSTVAALLVERFATAALVPGDAFFGFWTRGAVDPWLPEAHEQNTVVIAAAARAVGAFVLGGCPVVYDGVVGPWALPGFAQSTGLPHLHYVVLLPSLETCLQRVAGRTGHGFTDAAATRHMHRDFAAAVVDPRHVLHDPPRRAEQVVDVLTRRLETGELIHRP